MDAIKTLDTGNSLFFSHQEASTVDFFVNLINQRRNKQ
jgi:2,5-diketo-D-gluconate reductase A